ncbi:MAG TPA: hypothetical protein VFV38_35745 [Ktedonobacteraceae bacterium]|nr:hypothetical protein [Ktedonobacteraceae bacterium]
MQELAALGYHVVALSEYEKIYREGRNYVWPATDNDENLPDDAS